MNDTDQKAALAAVSTLLRPLVRIMIRLNLPFGSFAEAARQAYVRVADEEFRLQRKKQTASRVAVLTGLTRKEVARIQQLPEQNDSALNQRFNRCSRVISGWLHDTRFAPYGEPLALPLDGDEPNFKTLVTAYSGDMPARAVLDELCRIGATRVDAQEQVTLNQAAYIPTTDQTDKLAMMGRDTADLIDTIDHNLDRSGSDTRFQLKVEYDNLSREAVEAFRRFSDRHSMALLRQYDDWLGQHDRDTHPDLPGSGRYRAGVGLFYFEDELEPPAAPEPRP